MKQQLVVIYSLNLDRALFHKCWILLAVEIKWMLSSFHVAPVTTLFYTVTHSINMPVWAGTGHNGLGL